MAKVIKRKRKSTAKVRPMPGLEYRRLPAGTIVYEQGNTRQLRLMGAAWTLVVPEPPPDTSRDELG